MCDVEKLFKNLESNDEEENTEARLELAGVFQKSELLLPIPIVKIKNNILI